MAKRSSKSQTDVAAPTVDKEWQARSDANILRSAGEVMADRSRMSAAKQCIMKEQRGMQKMMGGAPRVGGKKG